VSDAQEIQKERERGRVSWKGGKSQRIQGDNVSGILYMVGQENNSSKNCIITYGRTRFLMSKPFVLGPGTMMILQHQLSINTKSNGPFVFKMILEESPAHDASFCT